MTQQQALLNIFKEGKTLNLLSAFKLTGCMKLSCRVNDTFEPMGYIFKKEKVVFKTQYKTSGYYYNCTLDRNKTPKKLLK